MGVVWNEQGAKQSLKKRNQEVEAAAKMGTVGGTCEKRVSYFNEEAVDLAGMGS